MPPKKASLNKTPPGQAGVLPPGPGKAAGEKSPPTAKAKESEANIYYCIPYLSFPPPTPSPPKGPSNQTEQGSQCPNGEFHT
jgi:hypothetical protein